MKQLAVPSQKILRANGGAQCPGCCWGVNRGNGDGGEGDRGLDCGTAPPAEGDSTAV